MRDGGDTKTRLNLWNGQECASLAIGYGRRPYRSEAATGDLQHLAITDSERVLTHVSTDENLKERGDLDGGTGNSGFFTMRDWLVSTHGVPAEQPIRYQDY